MCVNACPHDAAHRVHSIPFYLAAGGVVPLAKAKEMTEDDFSQSSIWDIVEAQLRQRGRDAAARGGYPEMRPVS